MIRFLLLGMSAVILSASPCLADGFDITQQDKQLHLTASYALALTSTRIMEVHRIPRWKSVLYSSLLTLAVGFGKEYLVDSSPSQGDLIADGIGTGVSAGFVFAFDL